MVSLDHATGVCVFGGGGGGGDVGRRGYMLYVCSGYMYGHVSYMLVWQCVDVWCGMCIREYMQVCGCAAWYVLEMGR